MTERSDRNYTELWIDALRRRNMQEIKNLIEEHPDLVNMVTDGRHQRSCLHGAAIGGDAFLLRLVLGAAENIPNVNQKDSKQLTPLQYAIMRGHSECVDELLKTPTIDVTVESPNKENLLHLAAIKGNVQILLEILAKITIGDIINKRDSREMTALHVAVEKCNHEFVSKLIEHGASCATMNWKHDTPLHTACQAGRVEKVELLLAQPGVDINARGSYESTALHNAAEFGHTDIIQLLIRNGASPDLKTSFGLLPAHLAIIYYYQDISLVAEMLNHLVTARNMEQLSVAWAVNGRPQTIMEMLERRNLHDIVRSWYIVTPVLTISEEEEICRFLVLENLKNFPDIDGFLLLLPLVRDIATFRPTTDQIEIPVADKVVFKRVDCRQTQSGCELINVDGGVRNGEIAWERMSVSVAMNINNALTRKFVEVSPDSHDTDSPRTCGQFGIWERSGAPQRYFVNMCTKAHMESEDTTCMHVLPLTDSPLSAGDLQTFHASELKRTLDDDGNQQILTAEVQRKYIQFLTDHVFCWTDRELCCDACWS